MRETSKRVWVLNLYLPIGLSLYNSVGRSLPGVDVNTLKTFIIYLLCSLPVFLSAHFFSQIALSQLSKTQLPRYLSLIIGGACAVVFAYCYLSGFALAVWHWIPWLKSGFSYDFSPSIGGFFLFLRSSTSLLFVPIWLCANLIYEYASKDWRYFKVPDQTHAEDGQTSPSLPSQPATTPAPELAAGFLSKIPLQLGASVIALEAQEHYIRVYTPAGSDLILYRFGDAVCELEALGLGIQVHRSYFIDPGQISQTKRSGRSMTLLMANGLEVPVSRSYRALVARLAREASAPALQDTSNPAALS